MNAVARVGLRAVGLFTALVGLAVSVMGPAMGAFEVPAGSVENWYRIRVVGIVGSVLVGLAMIWCGVALLLLRRSGLIGCGLIYAAQTALTLVAIARDSHFSQVAPLRIVALPPAVLVLLLACAAVTRRNPRQGSLA